MQKFIEFIQFKIHLLHKKIQFNKIYKKVDPYQSKKSEVEQLKYSVVYEFLKEKKYSSALEIACAEGYFTNRLSKICDRITGIDVSKNAIKRANKEYKKEEINFVCKSIFNFKPKNKYDLIIAIDVCYYLGQEHGWRYIDREMARWISWLNPNGVFVLLNCFTSEDPTDWLGIHVMRKFVEIAKKYNMALKHEQIINYNKGDFHRKYLLDIMEKP